METPEIFHTDCCYTASDAKNDDHFVVEDLLDFPNEESTAAVDGGLEAAMTGTSADSSTVTVVDTSCNSPFCGGGTVETHFSSAGGQFSSEICVPCDDVAELEWLSNFVEESFSSEDLQKLQFIQGMKPRNTDTSGTQHYQFQPETTKLPPEISVPGKARSKRSRAAHWASPLLAVAPTPNTNTVATPSSPEPVVKKASKLRKEAPENSSGGGEGRRCFHCATDKTPQWRTGPMGPKTLCNACGVRYKSGRLVPEYRPAASPTFVMTKHSNSHRKVLELRRQKEAQRSNHVQQHGFLNHYHNLMFDESDGGDYLIHQHVGPDFTQLI